MAQTQGSREQLGYTVAELRNSLEGYDVLKCIGQGGMGAAVFEARQEKLNRRVAVKVLPEHTALDSAKKARFHVEAEAMAKLHHGNIVDIHELGETEDGHLFIAMEYSGGGSLAEKLEAGPLDLKDVTRIFDQTCSAVAHAHEHGVVHRDLKPANILLDEEGEVRVGDFGLAKIFDETSESQVSALTMEGSVMGTYGYMAPEQFRGAGYDQRSDVYSIGVVTYQMLTGHLPQGVFEPVSKHRSDLPATLDRAMEKALRRDPDDRYPSVEKMRSSILTALQSSSTNTNSAGRIRSLAWIALPLLIGGLVWYFVNAPKKIENLPAVLAEFRKQGEAQHEIDLRLPNGARWNGNLSIDDANGFQWKPLGKMDPSLAKPVSKSDWTQLIGEAPPATLLRALVQEATISLPASIGLGSEVQLVNGQSPLFDRVCDLIEKLHESGALHYTPENGWALVGDAAPDFSAYCHVIGAIDSKNPGSEEDQLARVAVYQFLRGNEAPSHGAISEDDFRLPQKQIVYRTKAEVLAVAASGAVPDLDPLVAKILALSP